MRPVHGGNLAWAAEKAGCPPDAILDFSASISPLGPPQSAIAAIQANLGNLSYYPDPNYRELRAALSQSHQLPPEWILPGNGSAELLTWAAWDLAAFAATAGLQAFPCVCAAARNGKHTQGNQALPAQLAAGGLERVGVHHPAAGFAAGVHGFKRESSHGSTMYGGNTAAELSRG